MNLHQRRMRTVEAALQRLAKDIGPDVLFLPVEIVSEKTCGFPVACIDRFGIKVTEQCVDKDPMNIEVYIAHEIFHEVLEDESLHHLFPARVLNDGTDYKINQYLQEFYSYDVTKVYFAGLRNTKYDNLTIEQICNVLPKPKGAHFTPALRHPMITQIAKDIRTRHGLEVKHKDFIKFNYGETYYNELRKHYPTFEFENLPNINPDVVVRHLWLRHFQMSQKWEHGVFNKHLTHNQALALIPKTSSVDTEGDPELSMFAAMFIINALNSSHKIVRKQLHRLDRLEDSLVHRKRQLQEQRRVLRKTPGYRKELEAVEDKLSRIPKRLKSIKKRRRFLENLPKLPDLLKAEPSIRVKRFEPKWGCLSSAQALTSDMTKFDHGHEFVKLIQLFLKYVGADLAELDDIYNHVKDFTKDFAPDTEEEKEEADAEDEEDSDVEAALDRITVSSAEDKTDTQAEEKPATGAGDEDSDEDAEGGEEESAASDAGSSPGSDSDSDERDDKPEHSDGQIASDEPGDGQGKGQGNGGKLATLNTLAINPKIFKSILRHAYDFGEKLMVKPSYKASEDGLIDRTLTFGTDLSRLPSSELGRLGNEYAKLSFLVDLANGNLLQYVDLDPRRGPLVLMLDCSGSMNGKRYEIAAGFCLAMIMKLNKSERGVMLIKFSSGIDSIHIWEKGKSSPTLSDLLKALVTPSMSGTDFDRVMLECFHQLKKLQWRNPQGLLISDGEGGIAESTVAQKPTDLKLTAVLMTKKLALKGFEEIIHASRNGLELELTTVGNSMM